MNLRIEGKAGERARRTPFITVLLVLLYSTAIGICELHGQPQDILYVGDLNGDCQSDTVRGKEYGESRSFLPSQIVWGIVPPGAPPCTGATVHAPNGPVVPMTQILYPTTWANFSGSASFMRYNQNDGLPDMLLFLWGDAAQGHGISPARALVLFGQPGLDTLAVIVVETITYPLQSDPYVTLDLQLGTHLIEPMVRDYTGVESHELVPIAFLPHGGGTPPNRVVSVDAPSAERGGVVLYPNPAELWARLESSPLPRGRYTIVVVAVNGREYSKQEVELSEGMKLERELSLESLPSGTYMVRVIESGRLLSSHPIQVIH